MSKIGLIISREYLTRVKKKTFILMSFLGPLLIFGFVLLTSYLSQENKEKYEILVVDESHLFDSILRNSDKKLARDTFYLYGLFKLRCEIGDTWALSQTELAKETLGVGRPAALNAVDLLIKLKLIEIFEQDSHVNSGTTATIYRRIG